MLTMLAGSLPFYLTAEFWVAVAFFGFVGLIVYYKVPALVGKMLDDRADAIRREIDEARRLREEAQALLAEYHEKTRGAEEEANAIIEQARSEAAALTAETRRNLNEMLERRMRLAEEKIARAEAQALADVRASAVDTAIDAAQRILSSRAVPSAGSTLIDQSIRDLKGKLN
ncbi:MAG: F0F1 ATP synthase subunit B [Hyphomicrobiaceae bacterium]